MNNINIDTIGKKNNNYIFGVNAPNTNDGNGFLWNG